MKETEENKSLESISEEKMEKKLETSVSPKIFSSLDRRNSDKLRLLPINDSIRETVSS